MTKLAVTVVGGGRDESGELAAHVCLKGTSPLVAHLHVHMCVHARVCLFHLPSGSSLAAAWYMPAWYMYVHAFYVALSDLPFGSSLCMCMRSMYVHAFYVALSPAAW